MFNTGISRKLHVYVHVHAFKSPGSKKMEIEIFEILKIYDKIYRSNHPTEKPGIVVGEAAILGTGKIARGEIIKEGTKTAAKKGGKVVIKEGAKEGGKVAVKEVAKEGTKVALKEGAKEGGKVALKEGAKEGTKVAIKEVAKEGTKVALKEAAKEGGKVAIKEVAKEGTKVALKEAAKEGGKVALKEAAKEGGKVALKEAAKEGGKVALKEVAKEGGKVALKEAAKEGGKVAIKEGAKEGTKAAAKTSSKKIPIISIGAGLIFCGIRVGVGIYHCVQGETSQGVQEFIKAPIELASGIAGSIPGVGTAVSIGIDATLCAWDIGSAVHGHVAGSGGSKDTPLSVELNTYLFQVSEAIKGKQYTNEAFLSDIFESTYKKLGSTDDGKKAAENGLYIYEMVEKVFDNKFFDKSFSTEKICKVMERQGFSKIQIMSFRAQAKSKNRY